MPSKFVLLACLPPPRVEQTALLADAWDVLPPGDRVAECTVEEDDGELLFEVLRVRVFVMNRATVYVRCRHRLDSSGGAQLE